MGTMPEAKSTTCASSGSSPKRSRPEADQDIQPRQSPRGTRTRAKTVAQAAQAAWRNAALKATARKRLKVIYAVMRDVRPYEPR